MAQPPLSRQVAALEEELGTRLFERTARGAVPTAGGEVYFAHARRVLAQLDEGADDARRVARGEAEGAELAAVGDVLLVATEDHQTYRQGLGPLVVDDVEATVEDLVSRGATVVSTFSSPTGHGACVRHGGLDVEYLQWKPDILARVLGPAA